MGLIDSIKKKKDAIDDKPDRNKEEQELTIYDENIKEEVEFSIDFFSGIIVETSSHISVNVIASSEDVLKVKFLAEEVQGKVDKRAVIKNGKLQLDFLIEGSIGKAYVELICPYYTFDLLQIKTEMGDIKVNITATVFNKLKLYSEDGDIIVNSIADVIEDYIALDYVDVQTINGNIKLNLKAYDGDTIWKYADVNIRTNIGDILESSLFTENLNIETTSGDIYFFYLESDKTSIVTEYGDIDILIRATRDIDFAIKAENSEINLKTDNIAKIISNKGDKTIKEAGYVMNLSIINSGSTSYE